MATQRHIKRYSNRKLYDMNESRYVTLEEVALFIQNGEEVQIIDNKTKEDITSVTLAQIVYEQEKKRKNFLPVGTLKSIIRSSGRLFQEKIATPVATLKDDAERTVLSLRADAERRVNLIKEEAEKTLAIVIEKGDARPMIKQLAESTQKAYEDFAHMLEEGIHQAVRGSGSSDLSHWKKTIEQRLADLEKRAGSKQDD